MRQTFKQFFESKYSNDGGNGEPSGNYRDYSDADPDFELGRTNFPHGHAYPNSKKDYDKVVKLDVIHSNAEADNKFATKCYGATVAYIRDKAQWFVELSDAGIPPAGTHDSYQSMVHDIRRIITDVTYWLAEPLEKVTAPNAPAWWKEKWDRSQAIIKEYPNLKEDVEKLYEFLDFLYGDSPDNPENPINYPLFVTLYDKSRLFGGHEEGGWWYDYYDRLDSVKVQNFEQAEKVAKAFYNTKIGKADGQPLIILEKVVGSLTNEERPEYS